MVLSMDNAVDKIYKTLEDLGLDDNTVVAFASDVKEYSYYISS